MGRKKRLREINSCLKYKVCPDCRSRLSITSEGFYCNGCGVSLNNSDLDFIRLILGS